MLCAFNREDTAAYIILLLSHLVSHHLASFYTGHFVKREAKGVQISGSGGQGYNRTILASPPSSLTSGVCPKVSSYQQDEKLAWLLEKEVLDFFAQPGLQDNGTANLILAGFRFRQGCPQAEGQTWRQEASWGKTWVRWLCLGSPQDARVCQGMMPAASLWLFAEAFKGEEPPSRGAKASHPGVSCIRVPRYRPWKCKEGGPVRGEGLEVPASPFSHIPLALDAGTGLGDRRNCGTSNPIR